MRVSNLGERKKPAAEEVFSANAGLAAELKNVVQARSACAAGCPAGVGIQSGRARRRRRGVFPFFFPPDCLPEGRNRSCDSLTERLVDVTRPGMVRDGCSRDRDWGAPGLSSFFIGKIKRKDT